MQRIVFFLGDRLWLVCLGILAIALCVDPLLACVLTLGVALVCILRVLGFVAEHAAR